MYTKKRSFLCITILALASMFFAVQAWAQCTGPDPCDGINCGANGTCVNGTCVCDENWSGALCDVYTAPPVDLISGLPMMILGAPGTCETYQTNHPVTGNTLACCSTNATPKCNVGQTPDSVCKIVLEFCGTVAGPFPGTLVGGTASKTWDPDPTPTVTLPGHGTETGTWAYDGAIGMTMSTTSGLGAVTDYDSMVAVKAMDGSTLELDALLGVSAQDGSTLAGAWTTQIDTSVLMTGIIDMDLNVGKMMTVTDPDVGGPGAYDTSNAVSTYYACSGGFCNPPDTGTTTNETLVGTIAKPGALYALEDPTMTNPTSYALQPNAAATYTRVP